MTDLADESQWLSFRIEPEDRALLRELAAESGETMSALARERVGVYLDAARDARRIAAARRAAGLRVRVRNDNQR